MRTSLVRLEDKIDNIFPMLKEFMQEYLQPQLTNLKQEVFSRIDSTDHKFDKRIDNINIHRDGIYTKLETAQKNCQQINGKRLDDLETQMKEVKEENKETRDELQKFGSMLFSAKSVLFSFLKFLGIVLTIVGLIIAYLQLKGG